jgi:hypothetical protein
MTAVNSKISQPSQWIYAKLQVLKSDDQQHFTQLMHNASALFGANSNVIGHCLGVSHDVVFSLSFAFKTLRG